MFTVFGMLCGAVDSSTRHSKNTSMTRQLHCKTDVDETQLQDQTEQSKLLNATVRPTAADDNVYVICDDSFSIECCIL